MAYLKTLLPWWNAGEKNLKKKHQYSLTTPLRSQNRPTGFTAIRKGLHSPWSGSVIVELTLKWGQGTISKVRLWHWESNSPPDRNGMPLKSLLCRNYGLLGCDSQCLPTQMFVCNNILILFVVYFLSFLYMICVCHWLSEKWLISTNIYLHDVQNLLRNEPLITSHSYRILYGSSVCLTCLNSSWMMEFFFIMLIRIYCIYSEIF